MGGDKPGPAEKEAAQQSRQTFAQTSPVLEMVSRYIQSALAGDVGKFENSPIAQRKASLTRQGGDRRKSSAQRQLAGKGLDTSGAGMAYMNDLESQTSAAVLDAALSEMNRYLNIAPQFGLGGAGGGGGMLGVAGLEAQRTAQSSARNMQVAGSIGAGVGAIGGAALGTMVFPAVGTVAGAMLGGMLGTGAGGAIGNVM